MRRVDILTALFIALTMSVVSAAAPAEEPAPIKAVGSVELSDAAGDMGPISTSSGAEPPLDVVKLALKSDGTSLVIAATLKNPPGRFAHDVVKLYVDTDADPATGTAIDFGEQPGFEYVVELLMCIDYDDGGSACTGASKGANVARRWGAVDVERFKGKKQIDREPIVDSMGFYKAKRSARTPLTGNVLAATVDYADLNLKPGQKIRILARESGGIPKDGMGDFPRVVLTLK